MTPPEHLEKKAKIVEWNDQKGFGYVQVGKQRVFLHRNEFSERHKKPAVGDTVRFWLAGGLPSLRTIIEKPPVPRY